MLQRGVIHMEQGGQRPNNFSCRSGSGKSLVAGKRKSSPDTSLAQSMGLTQRQAGTQSRPQHLSHHFPSVSPVPQPGEYRPNPTSGALLLLLMFSKSAAYWSSPVHKGLEQWFSNAAASKSLGSLVKTGCWASSSELLVQV